MAWDFGKDPSATEIEVAILHARGAFDNDYTSGCPHRTTNPYALVGKPVKALVSAWQTEYETRKRDQETHDQRERVKSRSKNREAA